MDQVINALLAAEQFANRILLLITLIAALGLGSCATPGSTPIAIVDGRPVAYRVLGSGGPVVVMISGLGDGMASFEDVAPEIAKDATVIVYDRAGYGGSASAPGPRDAAAVDRELSGLLAQIGVRGPYVVLGHSLGGLYAEYFAAKHRDQVVGLILAESRSADFTRRCQAAQAGPCTAPAFLVQMMPKGARDELAALPATIAQAESIGAGKNLRVMVLSRSIQEEPSAFDAVWATAQNALAARYPGSQHLIAHDAGHYLHRDESEWFVATVGKFLKH